MSNLDYIGHFIRAYRHSNNLSLEALAAQSSVSKSMIANIESGQKTPTIAVLAKLAQAMSMQLADLVSPPDASHKVQIYEVNDENRFTKNDSPVAFHRVMPNITGFDTEFYRFYFKSFGKTDFLSNRAGVFKHLWLEKGQMKIYLGYEEIVLNAGQMLRFAASSPHRFECSRGELACGVFYVEKGH
jgi:transcriptional regulator with XRE-family HTH domain